MLLGMIEIEFLGHEPLEGWAREATSKQAPGSSIRFSGWVGLVQAIVALVDEDRSSQAPSRLGTERRRG